MAYTVPRTDQDELARVKLDDGRVAIVTVDWANIRYLIRKAQENATGRAVGGPVVVKIRNR